MNENMITETKKRKRILVLDGDQFQVDSFNDPVSARNSFKASFYDLLILDIKMPKMNGFQLYREIKNMDNKVKVCFLTALNEMHDYEEFKREVYPKAGERYFIQKPVENRTLLKQLDEI